MPDIVIRMREMVVEGEETTEVDIVNDALVMVGLDIITSLEQDIARARVCRRLYPSTRDAVLRAYPWNCAIVYAEIPVDATAPPWRYDYRFPLPSAPWCLRALELDDPALNYTFKIAGRWLYTNDVSETANLKYISRVTNPSYWDSLLRDAVSTRLSSLIAMPCGAGDDRAKLQWALYMEKIKEARSIDGMEGTTDPFMSTTLSDFRHAGG